MRRHGFFAVANAFAHHVRTHQTCHSGVDVHHGTASKVQRARLPDETGFGVHGVHHIGGGVGIRAHPEPHHVGYGGVAEGEPQHHKQEHGRKLHALGKRAHNQCACNARKRGLESGKHDFRNHHAFTEGGGVGKRT